MDRLGLLESLLESGLALVSFEDLGGQGLVVREQRVHPVALTVVGQSGLLQAPLAVGVPASRLAVGPRAAAPHLPEAMFGPDLPPDGEVAADLVAGEDRLDLLVDLMGGAQAGRRALQAPLQVGQVLDRGGEPLPPALLLA